MRAIVNKVPELTAKVLFHGSHSQHSDVISPSQVKHVAGAILNQLLHLTRLSQPDPRRADHRHLVGFLLQRAVRPLRERSLFHFVYFVEVTK